ncbi:PWI domain-containing protein C825.05c [Babesia microti strain RI]|uniref:PWI domain-containing protein C825.05c n=1 Tax=Babesia microti (strain RI) TaxID=1133968 RepID=A0A1N6LYE5_BABMR|nr:PWI domain-containing protein C825.05c [Babesia microti strain RI]SIO73885.1 PWI domain-containing protein C825.05c [Babesia microti strain RI]|eukprot:XP_021337936.1 PWI domain-containing protein C825.05c [Babesia microti strain RI]
MREHARYIRGGGTEGKPYLAVQEKELLETNKWSSVFKKQVYLSKVRIDVLRPWINKRINELMGIEDEILVEYIMTQLKEALQNESTKDLSEIKLLDPKLLVVNITGFMAKKAQPFVAELWEHMLSAQETEHGVPTGFIQDKKQEIEMLKQKSQLLDSELARQKEVKKESALEQIARGKDRNESTDKYRRQNNREYYLRRKDSYRSGRRYRDRDSRKRYRRSRSPRRRSSSSSRSSSGRSQSPRRRSSSCSRSRGSRRSYSPRRNMDTCRKRSDSRDSDYMRKRRSIKDERHMSRHSSGSMSKEYGNYRSNSRERRRRSEASNSDSDKTPSSVSSSYSPTREDSMSTSE